MKVILTKDVKKFGRGGDVVNVSEGYARNFLIPHDLAILATPEALKSRKAEMERSEEQTARWQKSARRFLERATSKAIEFELPGDKNGHLYAGLKESEILAKIMEGEPSFRNSVKIPGYTPIKTAGGHEVMVEIGRAGSKKIKIYVKAKD
ncbi:MAG: 50S ribosomal protein L9 [Candidatus Doudnabacteria bacterium RIFCSPHIGHO2_01_FULL_46_14]|uniref:Large ribosomal subunit protein bL9 n=1 Tax=Candidatus Doudnabacteria bacterium RIFCSPHIGHO2_01_FULL_46_14 TaxID=1817824 RepID=A0A1F5NP29_9BACT|nr:MAG: 50S ribosomal protein L9 [Candidatus Doudnabacteria bacterium RIFCSPHIGHO2_01_FULL_46_14]